MTCGGNHPTGVTLLDEVAAMVAKEV